MSSETEHPFAKSLRELEEALKSSSATNRDQAQATEEEEDCGCGSPTEEDATTERLGEEGGTEPDELPDVTTLAVGEEGGELPPDFPDATGILAEQGGFISDPLTVATTAAVGEEGGELPPPILETEEDATTERLGEEGGTEPQELPPPPPPLLPPPGPLDFPDPTGIAAEQGGFFSEPPLGPPSPLFPPPPDFPPPTDIAAELPPGPPDILEPPAQPTTLAVGEEGGDFDFTTEAIGEEGGFSEVAYGEYYPPLIDAVNNGVVPSLLDHYETYGQFEPERIGIFSGTLGNDNIVAFGNNTIISGVPIVGYDPLWRDVIFGGNGEGEQDVLIGQANPDATELFILGDNKVRPYSFYATLGDEDLDDYAVIQNFDVGSDRIQLSGFVTDYNFEVVNNSTYISQVTDGDLVGIVENVDNIQDATLIFEGY